MKRWSRLDWLIIIIFAALVALFYWRILTPNPANRRSFPPGDFSAQFWAFATLEVRELSAGRLPLWNPYTFAGAPFWADVQSAVFYPPSLLTLLLSGPWGFSLFALELEAIAHFWLAAVFMYLFIRHVTNSRAAAVVAALTFTFSGYLTGYPSQQLAVLEADVWLPLILFFIHRAAVHPRPDSSLSWLLAAGIAWAMTLLAGHPQSAHIVAYTATAYLLFCRFSAAGSLGQKIKTGLWQAGLFLVTGLGLAAVQFLPAVEYTLLSVRAAGAYDKMSGGFPITDLVQVLLPGQVSFYSPLYVGVAGLLLAVWGVFTATPHRRYTIFWAVVGLVSLLISFGGNTFLYSPLYLFTPGFSIFRGQERWAFVVAFSLSVLAGYGFSRLVTGQSRPHLQRLARLTQYFLLFALLLTFLFFYGLNHTGWTADSPFYGLLAASTLLTILLALAWVLWTFAPRLPPGVFTAFTAALICFDLFTANWQTNLYPQPPEWHTQMPNIVAAIKQDAPAGRPYRVYNEFRLYDNYGVPFEIEDLWGASPLRPARYDRFLAPPMPIERVWELFNVRYVITWRQELYVPSSIIYQEPANDGATYVHRLNRVGPRAWLVAQAEIAGNEAILQKITDPGFNPRRTALLEPGAETIAAQFHTPANTPPEGASVQFERLSPQALRVHVDTPAAALLILSEPYYPGWQAAVDGRPAPLLRVDYILRGVPVPAGSHTVTLNFRPLSFTVGAVASGLALLAVVATFLRRRAGQTTYPVQRNNHCES